MGIYRIERNLQGAGREEIDAAAFRAVACLHDFLGLNWVRSYYDDDAGLMTCDYRAENPQRIWEHAKLAHIPCDSVTSVTEYLPEAYL